ncbi:hypothetical protein FRC08_005249 [Ceratobasidium sp. 394]|nr:hypothetical protein FRC08_005249 [Ceratobasidium sp. 394]
MVSQDEEAEAQPAASWHLMVKIFPEDINRRQLFALKSSAEAASTTQQLVRLKIVFEESSDFFGRITLYNLELF